MSQWCYHSIGLAACPLRNKHKEPSRSNTTGICLIVVFFLNNHYHNISGENSDWNQITLKLSETEKCDSEVRFGLFGQKYCFQEKTQASWHCGRRRTCIYAFIDEKRKMQKFFVNIKSVLSFFCFQLWKKGRQSKMQNEFLCKTGLVSYEEFSHSSCSLQWMAQRIAVTTATKKTKQYEPI